jgi:hypothetical protein
MKRRLWLVLSVVLVMQAMWVGVVSAEYDSSGDITVSVTVAEDQLQISDWTGETTFETQEGAHDTVTDSTGQEVDHSYIWVEVNGVKILAVDPPKAWYN